MVAGTQEIMYWILGWGSHARVLEPESLKEEICAQAVTTLNNYRKNLTRKEASDPQLFQKARTNPRYTKPKF